MHLFYCSFPKLDRVSHAHMLSFSPIKTQHTLPSRALAFHPFDPANQLASRLLLFLASLSKRSSRRDRCVISSRVTMEIEEKVGLWRAKGRIYFWRVRLASRESRDDILRWRWIPGTDLWLLRRRGYRSLSARRLPFESRAESTLPATVDRATWFVNELN